MIATQPYIVYSLPAGRVTQALLGKNIEAVMENIGKFLSDFTTANVKLPNKIELCAHYPDIDAGEKSEPAGRLIRAAQALYGTGEEHPVAYNYPSGVPSKQRKITWELEKNDLEKALRFLKDCHPLHNSLELMFSYSFSFIDKTTRVELPDQQFVSDILVWLSRGKKVSPVFYFPFTSSNESFKEYLKEVEEVVPFKLERKYLRLARVNRQGTANTFSKIKDL